MGTKKMRSNGSGGAQDSKLHALPLQGSLYSLTLDEVQNQLGDLGKPLSSMNLDELLNAAGMGIIDGNVSSSQPTTLVPALSMQRQASLMLNSDLSKKTVDEVWRGIQQGKQSTNQERRVPKKQPTLGEITLEDFLVKAGIVAEPSSPDDQNTQPAQWIQYHNLQQQQHPPSMMQVYMPVPQPLPTGENSCMDPSYPEMQISMSPSMGILSETHTPRQKRVAPLDVVEKTLDRRQKRMIKNRESAARSRARKQAYTHELENKISRLEEENERLKKQKEVEKVMICAPLPEPKYQLRRTSSAPL